MKTTFTKKTSFLCLCIYFVVLSSCKSDADRMYAADYYNNLFTGEILSNAEFRRFHDSLIVMGANYNADSSKEGDMEVMIHYYNLIENDSTIQEFKYSIRAGKEYLVRVGSYEKIGMTVPQRTFQTRDGESVQIGGRQTKPTLINLWFVGCVGCVAEMPSLNILKEKYGDKVNFISMTFDSEKRVSKFLKTKEFNFSHIIEVEDEYIKQISTSPYPENIFINKEGEITHIEGGLPEYTDSPRIEYFESIIEKLL